MVFPYRVDRRLARNGRRESADWADEADLSTEIRWICSICWPIPRFRHS